MCGYVSTSSVVEPEGSKGAELRCRRAWVQIAAATLSGNSLRQTVHTHHASVQRAAKLVAALLRVARVTVGLAESNGSLLPGLWLMSPAGWLPRTGISSRTLRSLIEYGLPLPFLLVIIKNQSAWRKADLEQIRGVQLFCSWGQMDNFHCTTHPSTLIAMALCPRLSQVRDLQDLLGVHKQCCTIAQDYTVISDAKDLHKIQLL